MHAISGQGLQQGAARTARQVAAVWTSGAERSPCAASSCATHAACDAMAGMQRSVLVEARMTTDLTSTALMLQVSLLAQSAWQAAVRRGAHEWPRRHLVCACRHPRHVDACGAECA